MVFRERALESRRMKLYVGNLPYDTSEESLRKLFSRHGQVQRIWICNTRLGSPHGHGFVHMSDGPNAEEAIASLDGIQFEGSEITVHRARD
jgi:RNA recognition motif-containing protein